MKLNQAKAKMCVGVVWGIAILIAFFPFLGWNQYVPEGKQAQPPTHKYTAKKQTDRETDRQAH